MIHVKQRYVESQRHSFRKRGAHMQRTEQSRPPRIGYRRKILLAYPGLTESFRHHRHNILLMRPRCKLGHNTAVCLVHLLACYDIAEEQPVGYHCSRCIVTRGFYSKYYCFHLFLLVTSPSQLDHYPVISVKPQEVICKFNYFSSIRKR